MKIEVEKQRQVKKPGTKTVWETVETTTDIFTEEQYNNFINAAPWFRRLGGSCTQQRTYTCRGYLVWRDINTSPDKQNRTITVFNFS